MNKELKILKRISEDISNIGGRVFYVGGYVRDNLICEENKDIDVEIFNITPAQLKDILSKYGDVDEIGASFGILKIHGLDIDFAMPRTERKVGEGHKEFDVSVNPFMSYEEASMRRDFTINSIMKCVLSGEIIDCWGGLQDLRKGIIKHINDVTFVEDPLRVLRACQFSARFNFDIHKDTVELCKTIDLQRLPKERIFEEIKKALLKSTKPSIAFEWMLKMGVIDQLFPELKALADCEQNFEHHPEGSAWNHTMMVLDQASKIKHKSVNETNFMLGALCHDLGKPICTKLEDGKITSIGHERKGVEIAEKFISKLTAEKKIIEYVKEMVEQHMRPFIIYEGSKKAVRRFFTNYTNPMDIILLAIADHKGRLGRRDDDLTEFEDWFNNQLEEEKDKLVPLITGKDLIALGFKPGKNFGEILRQAFEMQIEGLDKDTIIEKILDMFILQKDDNLFDFLDKNIRIGS